MAFCLHNSRPSALAPPSPLPIPDSVPVPASESISLIPRTSRTGSRRTACSFSVSSSSSLGLVSSSSAASAPPFIHDVVKNPPELALLSLLFVLSTAIGAIFSLAIISIPTMIAFKKLGVSADKLSRIVSEEVPGTLSSLKLSGLEINELTQQLSNLRQKISGNHYSKKSRSKSPGSSASRNYPIID